MTAPIGKTVIVLGGFTGPTGTFESVNIIPNFTGPTGTFPIWNQATGPTGPNGTFKQVWDAAGAPTGAVKPLGTIKTVIIPGYNAGGGGSTLDPASMVGGALSNGNLTWTSDGSTNGAGAKSTTNKTTGKWYFEFTINQMPGGTLGGAGAFDNAAAISTATTNLGSHGGSGYVVNGPIFVNGSQPGNATMNGGARVPQVGDTIGVGIDADNKTITFQNWTSGGTQSPVVTMVSETNYVAAVFMSGTTPDFKVTINFGASAFAGTPFAGYTKWG